MKKFNEVFKYEIPAEIIIEAGAVSNLNTILTDNKTTVNLRKLLIFIDKNLYIRQRDDIDKIIAGIKRPVEVEIIDSGELIKTMAGAEMIYQICVKHSIKRDCGLMVIGGGTICDVIGFVSATYMRNLAMISIPTTMMSCADSVVGKVGVNYLMHKNLIGAWFTPALTVIDTNLIKSDSPKHISTGIAEIIKASFIDSKEKVMELQGDINKLISLDKVILEKYIALSLEVKIKSVKGDEKDIFGEHAKLSLGHTLADVIETISPFGFITHGEAVGLGMIFASRVNDIIEKSDLSAEILSKTIELVKSANLPDKLSIHIKDEELVQGLIRSKKSLGDKITLLLVKNYGDVGRIDDISPDIVKEAIRIIL